MAGGILGADQGSTGLLRHGTPQAYDPFLEYAFTHTGTFLHPRLDRRHLLGRSTRPGGHLPGAVPLPRLHPAGHELRPDRLAAGSRLQHEAIDLVDRTLTIVDGHGRRPVGHDHRLRRAQPGLRARADRRLDGDAGLHQPLRHYRPPVAGFQYAVRQQRGHHHRGRLLQQRPGPRAAVQREPVAGHRRLERGAHQAAGPAPTSSSTSCRLQRAPTTPTRRSTRTRHSARTRPSRCAPPPSRR